MTELELTTEKLMMTEKEKKIDELELELMTEKKKTNEIFQQHLKAKHSYEYNTGGNNEKKANERSTMMQVG